MCSRLDASTPSDKDQLLLKSSPAAAALLCSPVRAESLCSDCSASTTSNFSSASINSSWSFRVACQVEWIALKLQRFYPVSQGYGRVPLQNLDAAWKKYLIVSKFRGWVLQRSNLSKTYLTDSSNGSSIFPDFKDGSDGYISTQHIP